MKAFYGASTAALVATVANAIAANTEIKAITEQQVNNRTLLNDWRLSIEYSVDAEDGRAPEQNYISVTTILKNDNVTENFKRRIKDGEIFQTYFSLKDPEKASVIKI